MDTGELDELVRQIDAIVGVSASFQQSRFELPGEGASKRYAELWLHIREALDRVRTENGVDLTNPNEHQTLAAMWGWIWSEGGSGRERKERPKMLYARVRETLQLLSVGNASQGAARTGQSDKVGTEAYLVASLGTSSPVGFVCCDLDGFKAVNDQRGHPEGDRCLQAVLDAITWVVRTKGRVFRYGGDEFAVVLDNSDAYESRATSDRIRAVIEAAGKDFEVTASVGVSSSECDGRNSAAMIQAADDAMYVSKFTGKNRVTSTPVDNALLAEVRERRRTAPGRN